MMPLLFVDPLVPCALMRLDVFLLLDEMDLLIFNKGVLAVTTDLLRYIHNGFFISLLLSLSSPVCALILDVVDLLFGI